MTSTSTTHIRFVTMRVNVFPNYKRGSQQGSLLSSPSGSRSSSGSGSTHCPTVTAPSPKTARGEDVVCPARYPWTLPRGLGPQKLQRDIYKIYIYSLVESLLKKTVDLNDQSNRYFGFNFHNQTRFNKIQKFVFV